MPVLVRCVGQQLTGVEGQIKKVLELVVGSDDGAGIVAAGGGLRGGRAAQLRHLRREDAALQR